MTEIINRLVDWLRYHLPSWEQCKAEQRWKSGHGWDCCMRHFGHSGLHRTYDGRKF